MIEQSYNGFYNAEIEAHHGDVEKENKKKLVS